MNKRNAIIVGSGITGIITALYLKKKGYNVSIYELKDDIGGVLRDLKFNERSYFNGCQYLNSEAKWLKYLDEELINELHFFEHKYASYSDIFDDEIMEENYAMPISKKELVRKDSFYKKSYSNVQQRLKVYDDFTSSRLINFAEKYNSNINTLHFSSTDPMQIEKVYFKNNIKETLKLKKDNSHYDEIFGLPRSYLNNDKIHGYIPKNGYNIFFEKIKTYLSKKNIKLYFNTSINCKITSNDKAFKKIEFLQKNKIINYDLLVWCCNPVPLIYSLGLGKLDNPFINSQTIVSDFEEDNEIFNNPFYIQVYSKYSNITRLYFYKLNKIPKISIEILNKNRNNDLEFEYAFAKKIISKYNSKIQLKNNFNYINQKKHILFTNSDFEKFDLFSKEYKTKNIIHGGWHIYSRDNKIDYIINAVNQYFNLL
tara:strand:- start:11019 stop:12296 length:1278 start_codon:yes stop_codon:yes gene_type:complete